MTVALLEGTELAEAFADALLGIVADGAGVDEDVVGLLNIGCDSVARLLKKGGHNLAIGKVHLTAIGFDVNCGHGLGVCYLTITFWVGNVPICTR